MLTRAVRSLGWELGGGEVTEAGIRHKQSRFTRLSDEKKANRIDSKNK